MDLLSPIILLGQSLLEALLELEESLEAVLESKGRLLLLIEKLYDYAGKDHYKYFALSEMTRIRNFYSHNHLYSISKFDVDKTITSLETFRNWLWELIRDSPERCDRFGYLLEWTHTEIWALSKSKEFFDKVPSSYKEEKWEPSTEGELLEIPDLEEGPVEYKREPELNPQASTFEVEKDREISFSRPFAYYQNHSYWRDAIKNHRVLLQSGRHQGRAGKIVRWNGTTARVIFDGEDKQTLIRNTHTISFL